METTTTIAQSKNAVKAALSDRILLLATGLLAAWEIAVGINRMSTLPIVAYTIGFGVLLVACLLLIILGFEALDSPVVVILSTVIPLSLSLGLVWEYILEFRTIFLAFSILGFLAIIITRILPMENKSPLIILSVVHGIAGMTIFLMPFFLTFSGQTAPGFALVGVGGALIGLVGLLLSFQKAGKPIFSQLTILKILPGLLFITTAAFVIGFGAA